MVSISERCNGVDGLAEASSHEKRRASGSKSTNGIGGSVGLEDGSTLTDGLDEGSPLGCVEGEALGGSVGAELIGESVGESVKVKLAVELASWAAMKDAEVSRTDNLRSIVGLFIVRD